MEILNFIWGVVTFIVLTVLCIKFLGLCSELHKAVIAWKERSEVEKEAIQLRMLIDKEWIERQVK